MRNRCSDPNTDCYHRYGGRGITVCDRWLASFLNFLEDMGPRPSPQHSLDRWPDNDGNYEPGNCRWATQKQQANNRTSNRRITHAGMTLTVAEWSDLVKIPATVIESRLAKCNWSVEAALSVPSRGRHHLVTFGARTMSLSEWAREIGIGRDSLFARIYKLEWPLAEALTTPPQPRRFRPRRTVRCDHAAKSKDS